MTGMEIRWIIRNSQPPFPDPAPVAGFFFLDAVMCNEPLSAMQKTSFLKRLVAGSMIWLTLVLSTAQCFGGFALTKKLYQFNRSIMAGDNSMGARFVRTLVMWIMAIIPVYGIGMLVDLIILNLVEFWSGKPLIASSSGSEAKVTFTQINENEMRIDIKDAKISSFHVLRDRPGEFFLKEGSSYVPVIMPEDLKAFDVNGATSISCERTEAALVCSEGKGENATIQRAVEQAEYERLQYRARLALGIGARAASR